MIDFPASPTNGQIFNAPNGVAYQYSATYLSWLAQSAAPGVGPYLPLTGGTLAGPGTLVGTTATFVGGQSTLTVKNATTGATSIVLRRDGAATDEKAWEIFDGSGGGLNIRSLDDAGVTGVNAFSVARGTGTALTSATINPPLTLNGALTGTTAVLSGAATFDSATWGPVGIKGELSYTTAASIVRAKGTNQLRLNYGDGSGGVVVYDGGGGMGALTGGTATFNGGGFNGALKVTTNDSIIGGLFAGATKGVRIVPNAAYTAIEGVDNTGVGSYQPLTISGSVVNIAAPLSGTTATLSTAIAAGSNDTTVPTTAWVRANVGGGGSGKLLQTVYNRTGTGGTGTTIIPFDTTIPQITEGDEYMTLAVTPTSATSLLIVDVVWIGSSSAVNNMGVALFKDATASALTAAAATVTAANATVNIKFKYIMVSGSTTAMTFRVRAGGGAAGTTSFNSGTTFGFVMCSSMTIQEVTP